MFMLGLAASSQRFASNLVGAGPDKKRRIRAGNMAAVMRRALVDERTGIVCALS